MPRTKDGRRNSTYIYRVKEGGKKKREDKNNQNKMERKRKRKECERNSAN